MDGRELPGFYFDREKGKYFRITAGHGTPAEYKYTKSNIKKIRRREQAQRVEEKKSKRQKRETIIPTHAKSYLSTALLQREIGATRRSYLTQTLWPNACVTGYEPQSVVNPPSPGIRYFDRAPDSKCLYASVGETKIVRQYLKGDHVPTEYDEGHSYTHMSFDPILRKRETVAQMTSPVSSLNYLSTSGSLVITTSGTDRPPVVYFAEPDRDGAYVGVSFTPHSCNSIWAASPQPTDPVSEPGTSVLPTVTETVAVGLAAGGNSPLQIYTRSQAGEWSFTSPFHGDSDALSLCWLSPTMLIVGQRNGKIRLVDTRAHGSAHVLSHSTPITHIRRGDDFSRIVCAGICNTLAIYDIRGAGSPNQQQKRRQKWRLPFYSSRNITTYSGYQNENTMDLGMDVSQKLGLVAAADEENNLRLWNMYTGDVVKTFSTATVSHKIWRGRDDIADRLDEATTDISPMRWGDRSLRPLTASPLAKRIRCVRFVDEDDGEVSLWANVDGGVVRFGW